MRIVVSAGHGLLDPGAINSNLHLKEHLEAYQIAWELRDSLTAAGHSVEFISCFQTLAEKIAEVNALHQTEPVDLAIEIHFNSAASANAHGTEVLYFSTKNKALALSISGELSAALGTQDRGAVKRDNLGWLKRTHPPALIVETLFISNANDCQLVTASGFHMAVAEAIIRGLVQ